MARHLRLKRLCRFQLLYSLLNPALHLNKLFKIPHALINLPLHQKHNSLNKMPEPHQRLIILINVRNEMSRAAYVVVG